MERSREAHGNRPRASVWRIWLPVILLLLALDVTFDAWFWHIPKLTSWAHDRNYQFLHDVRRLLSSDDAHLRRSVAFGSSVVASFDPAQVEGLLRVSDAGSNVEVGRLLMAGMKPSDYRLFFEEKGEALRLDVVVAVLNLVDFLNPGFEHGANQSVRTVLPPGPTLREHWTEIPAMSEKLSLGFASVSNLYRYRAALQAAIQEHVKLVLRWLESRTPDHAYGIYEDLYTKPRFGVPIEGETAGGFEYYIHDEWVRQQGQVELRFWLDGEPLARRVERNGGWKSLDLPTTAGRGMLHVEADSAWVPRAAGMGEDARLLAVRLRTAPASRRLKGLSAPVRYPPLYGREFNPLLRVGDAVGEEFVRRWWRLLAEDTAFGRRFRAYQEAKLEVRERPFTPDGEYAELEELIEVLHRSGAVVVLVNSPESPLIRKALEGTPYYREHVRFLNNLAARHPGVHFRDLGDSLPAEDFNDWHHVNYVGRIKLGPIYASFVREALTDPHGTER